MKKLVKLCSTAAYSVSNAALSHPSYPGTRSENEFLLMSLGERAHIIRHILPAFTPARAAPPTKEFKVKYSRKWWEQNVMYVNERGALVNGDTAHFVLNACLFPERSQDGWVMKTPAPVDFYTVISHDNALSWYSGCPQHLQRRIDEEILKYPNAVDAKDTDEIYTRVAESWGPRPVIKYVDDPDFGRERLNHHLELELFNQWCYEYDQEVLRHVVLTNGPQLQSERKLLNQAMGIDVSAGDLPSQADGLDPTTSATVRWLQASGEMPLEFLARTYRSDDAKMSDRLTAARTLMDYVHRKIPQKQEIEQAILKPKLDPALFKGLSDKELETLEKLLSKLTENGE